VNFTQKHKPLDRFYLSPYEQAQMNAVLQSAKPECSAIGKLTGKYFADKLVSELERYATKLDTDDPPPLLGLQSRGKQYGGYSSELFVIHRRLLESQIQLWPRGMNTERFLDLVRQSVVAMDPQRVHVFDRIPLVHKVRRSGDNNLMTFL
tara:strand:+ start:1789 stop:2238 length:450 start_codon:yes stop_codon:yes gene_type:complete